MSNCAIHDWEMQTDFVAECKKCGMTTTIPEIVEETKRKPEERLRMARVRIDFAKSQKKTNPEVLLMALDEITTYLEEPHE